MSSSNSNVLEERENTVQFEKSHYFRTNLVQYHIVKSVLIESVIFEDPLYLFGLKMVGTIQIFLFFTGTSKKYGKITTIHFADQETSEST